MINWFNHLYPYSNLHELNLDWVIATVKNGEKEIADFIGVNTIKYANPILWNIESQYEANTVVVDGQTGNAYISVKAVPSGVHINRTEYWTQIYNYANVVDTLRAQIAHNEGDTTTATQPFAVGDLIFVKTLLYRVIAPMIAGDSFVENSNIVKTTIEDELKANIQAIQSEASARADADTALGQRIDDEATARADADTALGLRIDGEATARADADTALGLRIDDISNGVSVLNENQQRILNRKYVFIGDSYGLNPNESDSWVAKIIDNMGLNVGVNAFYYSEGGASFGGNDGFPLFSTMVNNITISGADLDDITDVVICGGYNDIGGVHGSTVLSIINGISTTKTNVNTRFPNAKLHIGFIGATTNSNLLIKLTIAVNAYIKACNTHSIHYLNNVEYCLHHDILIQNDGIHPTADGSIEIADAVTQSLLTGSADIIKTYQNATFTAKSGVTMTNFNWVVGCQLSNNNLFVNMFYSNDTTQFMFDPGVGISDEIELGSITDTYLIGSDFDTFSITAFCDVGGTTGSYLTNVPIRLSIRNRTLYGKISGSLSASELMNGLIIKGRYSISSSSLIN